MRRLVTASILSAAALLAGGCSEPEKSDDTGPECEPVSEVPYDGLDQDCDGEDLTDVDGDGYVYTGVGGRDCDDQNASIHPGANEICDGIDNDCDGDTDSEDADVYDGWLLGADTAYSDGDGDGFGDPESERLLCELESGWVDVGADCDDDDASVNPDAEEVCEDGIDNNCSGWDASCSTPTVIEASAKFTGENEGDFAGGGLGSGDFDGDGYSDFVVGASRWNLDGAAYVVFGAPAGTYSGTSSLSEADIKLTGSTDDAYTGIDLAGLGDTDGDGLDDIIILSRGRGYNYLVLGSTLSSTSGGELEYIADAMLYDDFPFTGNYMSEAGDVNADGLNDILLMSAGTLTHHGVYTYGMYVVFGPVSGYLHLDDADAEIFGESPGSDAGWDSAGVGDTDGDGIDDILIGAPGEWTGDTGGAAYLVRGPITSGDQELSSADGVMRGEERDYLGWSVSRAGDFNGDGLNDVLVGSPAAGISEGAQGSAFLIHGPMSGQYASSDADARFVGEEDTWAMNDRVSDAGDINADGFADILLGGQSSSSAHEGSGSVYLVLGPSSGTRSVSSADYRIDGDTENASASSSAPAGDFDGDGFPDFLIGAWMESSAGEEAGAAYLVLNADIEW